MTHVQCKYFNLTVTCHLYFIRFISKVTREMEF